RAELVMPYVDRCDVLLAGTAELCEILGASDDEGLARRAAGRGAGENVVRGNDRVGALSEGVWQTIAINRGDAVDPIGAGDAFNPGYVATRLRGGSTEEALQAGIRCGTAVTTAPSDTAAFPRSLS